MTVAVLVGLGAVGARAARQLVDGSELERVFLVDREAPRASSTARALGDKAEPLDWAPGRPLPEATRALVSAVPDPLDEAIAIAAVDHGIASVSALDDHMAIEHRFSLADQAERSGARVVLGAGLSPGVSDVLARHAASRFDVVDEIRVARSGWAGSDSVATLRRELRSPSVDRLNGEWRTLPRSGEEIVWFPDPIGARDCEPVNLGLRLLIESFPDTGTLSVVSSEPDGRVKFHRHRRRGDEAEWGATRVEVWGRTNGMNDVVVYGVIDRTAIAAGTMLAVATLAAIDALDGGLPESGVFGLGSTSRPVVLLEELARRGVRAAAFEGAAVTD